MPDADTLPCPTVQPHNSPASTSVVRAYLHDASSLLTIQFDPGGSDERDLRNRNYV
jgi:hypothetical protein